MCMSNSLLTSAIFFLAGQNQYKILYSLKPGNEKKSETRGFE